MNCADVEILICDYVDGTLAPAARAELERHLTECPSCAELAQDGAEAVQFMQRAADVEPPQELISQILFDPPWHKQRRSRIAGAFHAFLQPKFAMGMALTVLSFAMILPKMRNFQPADLSPAAVLAGIESRVYRLWERTEKYYDNLKFIYQIRATLRDWQQRAQEAQPEPEPGVSRSPSEQQRTEQKKLPVQAPPDQGRALGATGKP